MGAAGPIQIHLLLAGTSQIRVLLAATTGVPACGCRCQLATRGSCTCSHNLPALVLPQMR